MEQHDRSVRIRPFPPNSHSSEAVRVSRWIYRLISSSFRSPTSRPRARPTCCTLAEELEIENASTMRKGDMMFAILKDLAEEGVEIGGDGVLEVLQDGFGFLRSPEANYLAGPDDIYVSPNHDPPVRAPHRRHRRGRDPGAEGERALLRAGQGRADQLRGSGEGPAQGPLRQPDAALPRRAAQDGDRGSDDQGPLGAGHRPGGADRQGPARPDRRAAADRQDGDPAEHRRLDRQEPPGVLT